MICINNVSKSYDNNHWVLRDVCIKIEEGEMVAITGPSGSGKSTLLSIIGGIDNKYNGDLIFEGNLIKKNVNNLSDFRKQNVSFVLQNLSLIPNKTVYYNIALPLMYQKKDKKTIHNMVNEISTILGINNKLREYPRNLSGGEKQRVAIARAIIKNPKIILADEPTGALDENTKNEVIGILKKINKTGKTIIIVTHDRSVANCCNRIITLK